MSFLLIERYGNTHYKAHILIGLSKRNVIDLSKDLFSRHERERATQIRQIECEVVCDMFLAYTFFSLNLYHPSKKLQSIVFPSNINKERTDTKIIPFQEKKHRKKTPIPTV
uniref:Uncharacterized protein n=1 Tax=Populus davidiana TaxID=266767 RepID=A0A6M2ECD5_9ROSI